MLSSTYWLVLVYQFKQPIQKMAKGSRNSTHNFLYKYINKTEVLSSGGLKENF